MAVAAPALHIEPLSDRHDRQSFASDATPLDNYLRRQAGQDIWRRGASCLVLITDGIAPRLPIYTLAAIGIALAGCAAELGTTPSDGGGPMNLPQANRFGKGNVPNPPCQRIFNGSSSVSRNMRGSLRPDREDRSWPE
ncbi:MAG TPA: hypothetical protein VG848_08705 [Acetobacteraceae bacterium]|nr:hypothetical protein [Acetobacteraceae bacterium]